MPTNWNLAKLPSVLPSWFTPAETKDINFISQAQWGPQTTPWNRDSAGGGTYVPPNSKAWPTTFTANSQASSSWSNNSLGKNQTPATTPTLYPTASNPVTTLSKNPSGLQEYNYDDILAKDARGLKDYIDLIQINQQQGYKPTTEELYKVKKASDRLQELNAPTNLPDPYKAQIDAENQARAQREAELKARDENIISTEEARIKATLDQRKAEQDRQGVQVWEQTQSVLSFSGFGRSTYAADKQAEIQQTTNQNKNILTAEAEANKAKYRAQIAGATREELNQYDERINALKDKSAELQITNALQLNQIHQQEGVSYEDKVQNIFELADKNKPEIPLTPQQTQQASSYAKLIIWADWNVDTNLMKTIPPELLPEVMRQGAELRGATAEKQKEFGFINAGDWVIAVTNPNTGVVEYKKSWFTKVEQAKAPETVKTENWTFQFNPKSGRFDIPIDKVTQSWVPVTDAIARAIEECKTWAQCWKFVNDVLENAWMSRLVGDSYQSKVNAISKIWEATDQWDINEGSIFTYPVSWSSNWHIWIVTGINDDWTINIIDYNYKGDEQQRERTNVKISEITNLGWKISVPIVRNENTNIWPLTDKQFTQSNQVINSFKADPQVKAFEETFSAWLNLLSSLNDDSWPWDTASVYQFMKSLDPQSVVREWEFQLAASSAWVVSRLWNTFNKLASWEILTPDQRVAFGKLAKEYIRNKANLYQTKYKDWVKRLEKQGIDTSVFPTNIADSIENYIWEWQQTSTPTQWNTTQWDNSSKIDAFLEI